MNSAPSWSLKIWQIYDTYANLVFWDILSALKRIFYSLPAQWLLDRGEDILGFYKTADEWKAHDFGTNFGAEVGFFFNSGHFARVGPNQWNVLRITKKSYNRQLTILRKAVRRTDSLLFATEGRIGGLGAEPRFRARNLAVTLRRGWSREAVVRVMYRVAICWRWVSIPPWSVGRGRFGD